MSVNYDTYTEIFLIEWYRNVAILDRPCHYKPMCSELRGIISSTNTWPYTRPVCLLRVNIWGSLCLCMRCELSINVHETVTVSVVGWICTKIFNIITGHFVRKNCCWRLCSYVNLSLSKNQSLLSNGFNFFIFTRLAQLYILHELGNKKRLKLSLSTIWIYMYIKGRFTALLILNLGTW